MSKLKLTIITPKKVVLEKEIKGVTVPSVDGEITILPQHVHLFALLQEGIVHYWMEDAEDHLAIGGGYIETDGEQVRLLVSRAYGQDQIDKEATEKAIQQAAQLKQEAKTVESQKEISSLLRRSVIDMKLLKKKRRHTNS